MSASHGLSRVLDGGRRCVRANVREIDQDAETIHFRNDVHAKAAQPRIIVLVTSGSNKILGVIGELNHPDAEFVEERQTLDIILDRRHILEAEDDANTSLTLSGMEVRC